MNESTVVLEKKLKVRSQKMKKLKELIEWEEYERDRQIGQEKLKREMAVKRAEDRDKEIEKRGVEGYREQMDEWKRRQERKALEERQVWKGQISEKQERKNREVMSLQQNMQLKQKLNAEVQQRMNAIESRINSKQQKQLDQLSRIQHSRNHYSQHLQQKLTDYQRFQ